MRVLIVGGGIGGTTLALSLDQLGIPCTLFEAAAETKELGVGINVLPHATRELASLGLLPELDPIAIRTRELRYLNHRGQVLWAGPRGLWAGHDMPQLSVIAADSLVPCGEPHGHACPRMHYATVIASSTLLRTRPASLHTLPFQMAP